MKVILQQDVKGQGKKGQMIEASDGYARNFLLPRKLAVPATAENVNTMKMQEKAKKAQEAAEKAARKAQEVGRKARETAGQATQKAQDTAGKAARKAEDFSKKMDDMVDSICGHVDNLVSKIDDAFSDKDK